MVLTAILAVVALASSTTSVNAQESDRAQYYWQYAASGRLASVLTVDVDGDLVDEFLILDENGQLTLLSTDGQQKWAYHSPELITATGTLRTTNTQRDIVVAGTDYLMLLDNKGTQLWRLLLDVGTAPVAIESIDINRDGRDEILLLLGSGELLAYSDDGERVWQFAGQDILSTVVSPRMIVADFDNDGAEEIALGLFTPRRFSELIFIDDGSVKWRQAVSRRITDLTEVAFDTTQSMIAVGTNFGQLDLYSPDGELLWFRTVNRPISSLAAIDLPNETALAVGTEAGSVITFSAQGKRLWTNNLAREADRGVLALLPVGARTAAGQTSLAAVLEPIGTTSELADVLLLGTNGQTLTKLNDTDLPSVTQLVDVNGDNHYELLLARFATLQLIGLGIGDSEYVQEWEYKLDAEPTAMLVIDLDRDGEEEILVGTRDGRLHSLGADRTIRWLNAPGDSIAFLTAVEYSLTHPSRIAVVRRQRLPLDETSETVEALSWLELREPTGERLWEVEIPEHVTSLVVESRPGSGNATLLIGTASSYIAAYDLEGNQLWNQTMGQAIGSVRDMVVVNGVAGSPNSLLVAGNQLISRLSLDNGSILSSNFAVFDSPIEKVFAVRQPDNEELAVNVVLFTADGLVHGLNQQGAEMAHMGWPFVLVGMPEVIKSYDQGAIEAFQPKVTTFLVANRDGRVTQLNLTDNRPALIWTLADFGAVKAITWADLDKDGRPDTGAFGNRDGDIRLYDQLQSRTPRQILNLQLASSIFDLSLLRRSSRQSPDLMAITQNGLIRLFREEENRPPLLSEPKADIDQRQYSFQVLVKDVENDAVDVQLEMFDEANDAWQPISEQRLDSGNGQLLWSSVKIPVGSAKVNYRFRFTDGFYRGYLIPPEGPTVASLPPAEGMMPAVLGSASVLAIAFLVAYLRQARTPANQADQFYKRVSQNPERTLPLLEEKYASLRGSPDFLLQLANRSRRAGDLNLANLADGLFLLGNRPQAGLPIITRTLDDMAAAGKDWQKLPQRRLIYKTCQNMLDAPSITELGLVRPQFVHMLTVLEERKEWSPILESLLPVLTNMRDSERVDAIDDRLVYLNQAAVRLRQVQDQVNESPISIDSTLTRAITRRWSGLLSAEIEEQRGRAELKVTLKTKRLAPSPQTHVAMEIYNSGRAAAENIVAVLNENPAYHVRSEPQTIAFLPSGHSRQVRFLIEPLAEERFRVGLSLTYDDRNRHDKKAAFGDMVHLLPPVREFTPIANPYLPGTPLRKDSPLFYGREELFTFIAEHTDTQSQRNVFMLVGQRRTGKTSLLLRLEDWLPPHLIPVYIDCQSLGVSPGMAAVLQEFAWHIADQLGARGLDITVPDIKAWQDDPARVFQREFLPAARALLPAGTTLLMVFDEFEAFESMVADGILPRTFFPYMRHLMQHSTGLGFVFVGTRRLEEMSADYWSVLFNIALYRKIDFLSPEAAERLICEPVAPNLIYDDLATDKILRVTAGHPYFLQLVCYTLVKQANLQKTGYVTISDVNTGLDEMLRLGEVHFAFLWQRSNPTERAVLVATAHLMDRAVPLHPEEFIEYLQSYGIELSPVETTQALNSLVARDVMREVAEEGKTLYELKIGLVGLWVAQNKSLSKLHTHLEL